MQALERKPYVFVGLGWLWHSFWQLSAQRQAGMSVCAISLTDVVAWLDMHDEPLQGRQYFWRVIHTLDRSWLSWFHKKNKAQKAAKDADSTSSN